MTATNTDQIPPDTRPIDEMPFGSGASDPRAVAKAVRETLHRCGVNVAREIEELGCTGASAKGLTTTQIAELRVGLAGGGVGLTCFVPPTRYCLAHSTIGGLQLGQAARFSEEIAKISRDLSPRERGHVELIEASRRVRGGDLNERLLKTTDALSGRDLPPGVEHAEESDTGFEDDQPFRQVAEQAPRETVMQAGAGFVCPEHRVPVWSCRYCAAQMIVEGPLEPEYVVDSPHPTGDTEINTVTPVEMDAHIASCEAADCETITVYVRAATFSRKLARD
jgi:hypothetical protein